MRNIFLSFLAFLVSLTVIAQTPKTYTSADILLNLKKLNVLGSVLYIAAHPDDENTRLLAYLANEKLYRTGYLSLTRGDGGQNLIGDEQGIDLGLIRTQELLAARRIDGAEQFFTTAYDFGYCKTSAEALKTWNHDKILGDVVWVIRKFRPDVIISRFPEDTRAGHGHHAAAGILAREAFEAAADSTRFVEQFRQGVTPWNAKRLLWNTYSFSTTNTQSEDQFKIEVGMYNPLLGKSYGEIAALSRSQHKSQGFGVAAQRGSTIEYFVTIKGDVPKEGIMDGIRSYWSRTSIYDQNNLLADSIQTSIEKIIDSFSVVAPESSLPGLVKLYRLVGKSKDQYWREQKLVEIKNIIEACSGIFLEASATVAYVAQGDSLKIDFIVNNRLGVNTSKISANFKESNILFSDLKKNVNTIVAKTIFIDNNEKLTQPYWLEHPMAKGSFNVSDQQLIGKAESQPLLALFKVSIEGEDFMFEKPIYYKYVDPVKGELYQPLYIVPSVVVNLSSSVGLHNLSKANTKFSLASSYKLLTENKSALKGMEHETEFSKLSRGDIYYTTNILNIDRKKNMIDSIITEVFTDVNHNVYKTIKEIDYDHIPSIKYFITAQTKIVLADVKIKGSNVGYIVGAGDKVPQALEQMGYKVTMLKEIDITTNNLKQFDAIVTGVRAYNINEWLSSKYDVLMQYVKNGGVLLTQYNTNNLIGPVKAKISPYPFTITRNRITDEEAAVTFLLPNHSVLNYPNKITAKDFEGWIQERSIYNAENIDSSYQRILSMKDSGEEAQDGSLIIANYGKGKFIYTGLAFFRELPAGVAGAYRLFANLLAKPQRNRK